MTCCLTNISFTWKEDEQELRFKGLSLEKSSVVVVILDENGSFIMLKNLNISPGCFDSVWPLNLGQNIYKVLVKEVESAAIIYQTSIKRLQ